MYDLRTLKLLRNNLALTTLFIAQFALADISEEYGIYLEYFTPVFNTETKELFAAACHNDKQASELLAQASVSTYLSEKSVSSKEEVFNNEYTLILESAVVSIASEIDVIKQETLLIGAESKTCSLIRTLLTKS